MRAYLSDLTAGIPRMAAPEDARGRTAPELVITCATTTDATGTAQPDLGELVDAVRELASRPVVVQVGATEIARATADGARILSRR